jgi:hypothetical protein
VIDDFNRRGLDIEVDLPHFARIIRAHGRKPMNESWILGLSDR